MLQPQKNVVKLEEYPFLNLSRKKKLIGDSALDLSIGDPDFMPPKETIEALQIALSQKENHRYCPGSGIESLRTAVANWYRRRFGVLLDQDSEICLLLGSKEGLIHFIWTYLGEGDYCLVPGLGHTMYTGGVTLAGGIPYRIPLDEAFMPCLEEIPRDVVAQAKVMILNYPNNPTGAVITEERLRACVEFASTNGLIMCYDNVYSEILFDGATTLSPLQWKEAKTHCVEFHSLSKTFSMTGWRVGFVVGNASLISNLIKVKSYIDDGIFKPIQLAGIAALTNCDYYVSQIQREYSHKRQKVMSLLDEAGFEYYKGQGTFYFWVRIPEGFTTSKEFTTVLFEETGVLVVPGDAFGPAGEGFFRLSFASDDDRLEAALLKMKRYLRGV